MADVIKEFLVSLGYKSNTADEKKFLDTINKATRTVESFGKATGAAVTSIAYALDEITLRLENFYYVAQRSNTSVGNLMSLRFAADQIGVGADAATASINALARTIFANPVGYGGLFQSIGIEIGKAGGGIKDSTDLYIEFIKKLKELGGPGTQGFAIATKYAEMFHISPDELLTAEAGLDKMIEKREVYNKLVLAAGYNQDATAKKAVELQNALGLVNADLGIFGDLMINAWYEPVKKALEVTHEFLQWINSLDQATDGWSTRLISVATALGSVYFAVRTLTGALALLGVGGGASTAAAAASGAGGMLGAVGRLALRLSPWTAGIATALHSSAANAGEEEYMKAHPETFGYGYNSKKDTPYGANEGKSLSNTDAAMNYFLKRGWNRAQAAGIVAGLSDESGLNTGAIGDSGKAYGVAQWHPDRQKDFKDWSGHDIRQSTLEEQLAFVEHELLKGKEQGAGRAILGVEEGPGGAGLAGDLFRRMYERPKDTEGAAAHSSYLATRLYSSDTSKTAGSYDATDTAGGVVLNQSTNIIVHGGGDPAATGSAVAGQQSRVNGDLVRNFKNPMQ